MRNRGRIDRLELGTLKKVVQELYEVPSNSTGQQKVQFSFASKLVHMCQPTLPVYDAMVKTFFFLPKAHGDSIDTQLPELMVDYRFLIDEYSRVMRDHLLDRAMSRVREYCAYATNLTDQRLIDLLIWVFVKWAKSGGIRTGTARYS